MEECLAQNTLRSKPFQRYLPDVRNVLVRLLQGLHSGQDACLKVISERRHRPDTSSHPPDGSQSSIRSPSPDVAGSQENHHQSDPDVGPASGPLGKVFAASNRNPSISGVDSSPCPPSVGESSGSGFVSGFVVPRLSSVDELGPPSSTPPLRRVLVVSSYPFNDDYIRSTSSPTVRPAQTPQQSRAVPPKADINSINIFGSQHITTIVRVRALEIVYSPPSTNIFTFSSFLNFYAQAAAESAFMRLLISFKALAEALTRWGEQQITDTDVCVVYAQLEDNLSVVLTRFAIHEIGIELVPPSSILFHSQHETCRH